MTFIPDHATESRKWRWKLIRIQFSTILYVTDCPVAIEYGGHTYVPHGVTVSQIQNPDTGPTMSFSAADADNFFFTPLNASNGGQGIVVDCYLAEFVVGSTSAAPDDVVQVYTGRIASASKNMAGGKDEVQINCGPPAMVTAINFPIRTFSNLVRVAP
jgi:hypothetical protein